MSAAEFLSALMDGVHPHSLNYKPKGGKFRTDGLYTSPDELLDAADRRTAQGCDVWFGVHPLVDCVEDGRGGNAEVFGVRCIDADLDWDDPEAHADPDLPDEEKVRKVVAELEHKPTYIVESGHGLQAYWVLARTVSPIEGAQLIAGMHKLLAGKGLKPDRADLASVLRLPGTVNYKADPVDVRIATARPTDRYQPENLAKYLPHVTNGAGAGSGSKKWGQVDRDGLDPVDLQCLKILEQLGGHDAFQQGGTVYVVGPDSKADRAASISYVGPGIVHIFTNSWKPFKKDANYSLDTLERMVGGDQIPEDGDGKRHVVLTPASAVTVRPVFWMWEGRIPVGALTLIGGREGIGKTTIAYQLAADITRGRLDGVHHGTPKAVIICATEDSWEHTIVPRLMAADADLDRIYRADVVTSEGVDSTLSLPADLHELEEAIRSVGAALVILDPLLSRLHVSLDTHKDAEVRLALEPLVKMADRSNAAVVGLIHVNKSSSTDPLTLLMASRAFAAVARAVLFVMRSPDDDDIRLIGQPKNNVGRIDLPTLQFTIVSKKVADTDEGEVWTGAIRWEGESDRSIADYLEDGSEGGSIHTAAGEAADWLYDYLLTQGGAALSKDCKDAGGKVGHTHAALKRACKKLHIETTSEGFPRITWWRLRQSAQSVGESEPIRPIGPTGRDQVLREASVGPVGPVGPVRPTPQEGAPTGEVCEACSTTAEGVAWHGRTHQLLCRECWPSPPAATEGELF